MIGLGYYYSATNCPTGTAWNANAGACFADNGNGMPIATPDMCSSSQTYIPPGGKFTNGQLTPTGACQDTGIAGLLYGSPFSLGYGPFYLIGGAIVLYMLLK